VFAASVEGMLFSPRSVRQLWPAVLGVVAMVVGILLVCWAQTVTISYGWFAYAPLSGSAFAPSDGSTGLLAGVALVVIGLAVIAFCSGAASAAGRFRRPGRLVSLLALAVVLAGVAVVALSSLGIEAGVSVVATKEMFAAGSVASTRLAWGTSLIGVGIAVVAFWSGRRFARRPADTTKGPHRSVQAPREDS
jgi:hypothetical protein